MTEEKKRHIPIRISRVELEDEWEGWWYDARVNAPLIVLEHLSEGTFRQIRMAWEEIVQDWNFVDENGDPLFEPVYDENGNKTGQKPNVKRITVNLSRHMAGRFYLRLQELRPE